MAAVSRAERQLTGQSMVLLTLGFWLSSSLILDGMIMPIFSAFGMMVEPGFATVAYSLFWVFNRVELLCAAVILTGALVGYYGQSQGLRSTRKEIGFAAMLLAIALLHTYGLAPWMSSLGLQLNLFAPLPETPALMNLLHAGYWVSEAVKLVLGTVLLQHWYRPAADRSIDLVGSVQ